MDRGTASDLALPYLQISLDVSNQVLYYALNLQFAFKE